MNFTDERKLLKNEKLEIMEINYKFIGYNGQNYIDNGKIMNLISGKGLVHKISKGYLKLNISKKNYPN